MVDNKQTKILPKVISYIGMAICTLFTFMGLVLATNGNILLTAFVCIIILFMLLFLTVRLVEEKTKIRDVKNLRPEFMYGLAYLFVFVIIFPFKFHYLFVDFSRKKEIQTIGKKKLEAVSTLIGDYKKEVEILASKYDSVKTLINSYFNAEKQETKIKLRKLIENATDFLISSVDYQNYENNPKDEYFRKKLETQLYNVIEIRKDKIRKDYDLDGLDKKFETEYKIKVSKVFENWFSNRLKISYYYYDIDNKYKELYELMLQKMPTIKGKFKEKIEVPDLYINNPFKSIKDATFGEFLVILVITIIIHFLILTNYFVTKRPPSIFLPPKIEDIGLIEYLLLLLGLRKKYTLKDDFHKNN